MININDSNTHSSNVLDDDKLEKNLALMVNQLKNFNNTELLEMLNHYLLLQDGLSIEPNTPLDSDGGMQMRMIVSEESLENGMQRHIIGRQELNQILSLIR